MVQIIWYQYIARKGKQGRKELGPGWKLWGQQEDNLKGRKCEHTHGTCVYNTLRTWRRAILLVNRKQGQ